MTPIELNAWVLAVSALVQGGITVGQKLGTFVRSLRPQTTDEELNTIVQGVMASARGRRVRINAERAALRELPGWVDEEDED